MARANFKQNQHSTVRRILQYSREFGLWKNFTAVEDASVIKFNRNISTVGRVGGWEKGREGVKKREVRRGREKEEVLKVLIGCTYRMIL